MILCLAWGVNANTAIVSIIIYYKLILLPPDLCEQGVPGNWKHLSSRIISFLHLSSELCLDTVNLYFFI